MRITCDCILSHFQVNALSDYYKAMFAYLRLIALKGLPVSIVEEAEFRSESRYCQEICQKTMTRVILKQVELVEHLMSSGMRDTRCAIICDGWSANNMHFTAIIASYCSTAKCRKGFLSRTVSTPSLSLLIISPMSNANEEHDAITSSETTAFNAEAYVNFFRETFEIYGIRFEYWCVALIGDNVSSNKKMSSITGISHVDCASHWLNLEVKTMLESHSDLRHTIVSVHDTMKAVKTKMKSAYVLRNLTELRPVLHNDTRWSGKVALLRCFSKIRDKLVEASEHHDAECTVNASVTFLRKSQKYEAMFSEIDIVTKSIQKRG